LGTRAETAAPRQSHVENKAVTESPLSKFFTALQIFLTRF
jgi:hypothetical protein